MDEALVIVGSDRRGTIYGIYELSKQIGVSPWYWWMDVPIQQNSNIGIMEGVFTDGEPKVEYRGIFLNDEWPALGKWASTTFGGFNSKFYANVFELLLRLKANYLWPAMWASAFYDDDPQNGQLAHDMGIIVGTSHHEPMALAQQDWKRRGVGEWDYTTNSKGLQEFWKAGMERAQNWESLITIGMRGDGDMAMSDDMNIPLMENIIDGQRAIIEGVTGKKASETPQIWALYKEVQDYYDHGMRVPEDVILLLCDDNWGNVRRLPSPQEAKHKGGYGMYYHFDYVGAPRNSKWINISPIPRVWEQMNLTYEAGVDKLWIVNVGDLKPMEYPITFFLDMAWNPEQFNADNLIEHSINFCQSIFGNDNAEEAARLLRTYAKYNRRVTPESLNSKTYTFNYDEWENVYNDYTRLAYDALRLRYTLPDEMMDAYDQLIGYPIMACANLYEMYYAQAMNELLFAQNAAQANTWATTVERCFARDKELEVFYHDKIANGKWKHMMSQVRIGYKSWNSPKEAVMPTVNRVFAPAPLNRLFTEKEGVVSIEAEHFSRAGNKDEVQWIIIPELGKTLSGLTALPTTVSPEGMYVEYDIENLKAGDVKVVVRLAPTLNYNQDGLRYAISFNGEEEQIININGDYDGSLGRIQAQHQIIKRSTHQIAETGKQTLRIRPLDPGIVFEKIMINTGGLKKSYLGAPETLKAEL